MLFVFLFLLRRLFVAFSTPQLHIILTFELRICGRFIAEKRIFFSSSRCYSVECGINESNDCQMWFSFTNDLINVV